MAYGLFSAWRSARSRIDRPYHYLVLTVMLMLLFEDASLTIPIVLVLGAVAYANMAATVNVGAGEREAHLPARVAAALANLPSNRHPAEEVFLLATRDSVRRAWNHAIKRAGIERLTAHSCRHGFAANMLRAGNDVETVAGLGGWKDAATVLRYYAYAIEDRTLTDALSDTPLTQLGPGEGKTKRL